ncbi:ATP-binding protein [Niabella sp. CJ426]|uniref:tetratricopeptide repeat-containing sensor histidine kinase n=1 Tax=Niabella sp. CJ426 TaxID=3393740 RepID=UPI003D051654
MKKGLLYPILWIILQNLLSCEQASPTRILNPSKDTLILSADYKKAEQFQNDFQNDSAFQYFNKVTILAKDSLEAAMAYNKMAILQNDAGDYFGSQESIIASLKLLNNQKKRDHYCLFSNYNELGFINLNLKNFEKAAYYFDEALKFVPRDEFHKVTTLNNKALAYQKKKDYAKAITIFESIIEQSKKNPIEYARILSNLAKTKWLQDSSYFAKQELLTAFQIRKENKSSWGLNASYGQLADYYAKSQPDSAFYYANALYHIARYLKSPDDELSALSKLILLSDHEASKQYFKQHQLLNDSLQTARNNAKNQFALIRFNTKQHEANNLILQKENAETRLRIIWWQLALVIGSIITITGFILYRRKKQQAIREQQLRLSQKVHDKVANKVYSIMSEVEHKGVPNRAILLYKLNYVYKQSRDISYDQPGNDWQDFQQSVAELLESFASDTIRISSVGNSQELWRKIPPSVKEELSIIMEELMTNMKKHSSAQNVVVKFVQKEKGVEIQYTDDGIGFPGNFRYGNGLSSTENRIQSIGGRIIFDSDPGKGLKIQLFIPTE